MGGGRDSQQAMCKKLQKTKKLRTLRATENSSLEFGSSVPHTNVYIKEYWKNEANHEVAEDDLAKLTHELISAALVRIISAKSSNNNFFQFLTIFAAMVTGDPSTRA